MDRWLTQALDYIPQWLEFQMQANDQVGCSFAVAHKGQLVIEQAFGHADLSSGKKLTPRHHFRVASHSKTFTAAGILKLREQGRLRLDDVAGAYVSDLHPEVAAVTLNQLLTHSAGIIRDGDDAGQWADRRPFLKAEELRRALGEKPTIDSNTRFKYSNHGFGLLGLVIEAISGESYVEWIAREVVKAAKLSSTHPDWPAQAKAIQPFARGHGDKMLLGRRYVIPCDNVTHALAAATGFISTAADLALFYSQLDPATTRSFLSVASRREMTRLQWQNPMTPTPQSYGLGLTGGDISGWDWVGHSGAFQGCLSKTAVLLGRELSLSVITNLNTGLSGMWLDGAVAILREFATRGAGGAKTKAWRGRWWSPWGAVDLIPMADHIIVAAPASFNPFAGASEIDVSSRDAGSVRLAGGFGSHGEPARLTRNKNGEVSEVWLGGTRFLPAAKVRRDLKRRYRTVAD